MAAITLIGPAAYRIDARLMRSGKQFRKREMVEGSKRTAETRYRQMMIELEEIASRGAHARSSSSLTFCEALKRYEERKGIPAGCPFVFYRWIEATKSFVPLGQFPKAWAAACKTAKIENLRFHDLRHIAATDLVNRGTPDRVVRQLAGWKSDMLGTYYHRDGMKACKEAVFG